MENYYSYSGVSAEGAVMDFAEKVGSKMNPAIDFFGKWRRVAPFGFVIGIQNEDGTYDDSRNATLDMEYLPWEPLGMGKRLTNEAKEFLSKVDKNADPYMYTLSALLLKDQKATETALDSLNIAGISDDEFGFLMLLLSSEYPVLALDVASKMMEKRDVPVCAIGALRTNIAYLRYKELVDRFESAFFMSCMKNAEEMSSAKRFDFLCDKACLFLTFARYSEALPILCELTDIASEKKTEAILNVFHLDVDSLMALIEKISLNKPLVYKEETELGNKILNMLLRVIADDESNPNSARNAQRKFIKKLSEEPRAYPSDSLITTRRVIISSSEEQSEEVNYDVFPLSAIVLTFGVGKRELVEFFREGIIAEGDFKAALASLELAYDIGEQSTSFKRKLYEFLQAGINLQMNDLYVLATRLAIDLEEWVQAKELLSHISDKHPFVKKKMELETLLLGKTGDIKGAKALANDLVRLDPSYWRLIDWLDGETYRIIANKDEYIDELYARYCKDVASRHKTEARFEDTGL